MREITYHKEGDYYIPDLYLAEDEYEKKLSYWKVWSFKTRIFEKA